MVIEPAPDDVVALADARAVARRARDWSTADELLARITSAGWKVIDVGTLYDLVRAAPLDVAIGDVLRYGSAASVPSRLDEAAQGVATLILLATDWPTDLARTIAAVAATSPAGTQIVVVGNGESADQAAALDALAGAGDPVPGVALEVVRTSSRLGFAAALNVGIRRAIAPVVILLDTSVEPGSDLVTAITTALADPTVAVAGPFALVSTDLRHFTEAASGMVDVDAIEGYALGFRRADYSARGPLDEHFGFYRNLDIWWSLVLRDLGEEEPDDATPRRAVRLSGLHLQRHAHREWDSLSGPARERASKKNFYRVLKSFATRRDLLVAPGDDPS